MSFQDRERQAEEVHDRQPNLFFSVLVLQCYGATLAQIEVVLNLLLVFYEAMKLMQSGAFANMMQGMLKNYTELLTELSQGGMAMLSQGQATMTRQVQESPTTSSTRLTLAGDAHARQLDRLTGIGDGRAAGSCRAARCLYRLSVSLQSVTFDLLIGTADRPHWHQAMAATMLMLAALNLGECIADVASRSANRTR